MVDCILCYAATYLVEQMTDPSHDAGRVMLERVRNDARGSKQVSASLRVAYLLRSPSSMLASLLEAVEMLGNVYYSRLHIEDKAGPAVRLCRGVRPDVYPTSTPTQRTGMSRGSNKLAMSCRCWSWRTCTPRPTAPAWPPCDRRCSASGTPRWRLGSGAASPWV